MVGAGGGTDDPEYPLAFGPLRTETGAGLNLGARLGYRPIPWVGPWADFSGGWLSRGKMFSAGVGVALYPVRLGRLDPYLDLGFTYAHWSSRADPGWGNKDDVILKGYALRVGLGFPVFVSPRVSVGPALRVDVPSWGEVCLDGETFNNRCHDMSDMDSEFENTLPTLWRAGLEVVFHPSPPR
jgi:hypothetical protein